MTKKTMRRLAWLPIVVGAVALYASPAGAHGERSQEPFLRMRTLLFYDTKFTKTQVKVGETLELTGRVHAFKQWPEAVYKPDGVWLNFATPGPSLIRKGSYLNGVNMMNSTGLELGRDYEYRNIIMGRRPGRFHVHPMINIEGGGPLTGPGEWITVEGDFGAFTNPVTTLTGETVDLETFGLGRVVGWWLVWAIIGAAWLVYWVRRPIAGRALLVGNVPESELISDGDRRTAWAFLIVTLVLVIGGYYQTKAAYPITIPLQAGRVTVPPLPLPPHVVDVTLEKATYDVPGRALYMTLRVTNVGDKPLQLGEFNTANEGFINPAVTPNPQIRLAVEPSEPINPGETKTLKVTAADPIWEYQRLAELIYDPDSRFGGLLFFYDNTPEKKRTVIPIGGPIIPVFARVGGI
jgi:methane/ammonia monooxygenase subunit B